MEFKMRKQYDHIRLSEHENGAILVRALNGANITIIDTTINGYRAQLDKIDHFQGKKMREMGVQ